MITLFCLQLVTGANVVYRIKVLFTVVLSAIWIALVGYIAVADTLALRSSNSASISIPVLDFDHNDVEISYALNTDGTLLDPWTVPDSVTLPTGQPFLDFVNQGFQREEDHYSSGRIEEARRVAEDMSDQITAVLGPEHPYTLAFREWHAMNYSFDHRCDLALPILHDDLDRQISVLGTHHPTLASALRTVCLCEMRMGREDRAYDACQRVPRILQASTPNDQEAINEVNLELGQVADWLVKTQRLDNTPDAGGVFKRRIDGSPQAPYSLPPNIRSLTRAERRRSEEIGERFSEPDFVFGSPEDLSLLRELIDLREQTFGPNHPAIAQTLLIYAASLARTGDTYAAFSSAYRAYDIAHWQLGPGHPVTIEALEVIADVQLRSINACARKTMRYAMALRRASPFEQSYPESYVRGLEDAIDERFIGQDECAFSPYPE